MVESIIHYSILGSIMNSGVSLAKNTSNIFLGACVGAAVVIIAFQVFGIGKEVPADMQALNAFISIPGIEEFMIAALVDSFPSMKDQDYRILVYFNQPCESCADADFLQYLGQVSQENNNIGAMAFVHPDESENDIKNIRVNYGIDINIVSLPDAFKSEIDSSVYFRYFNGLVFITKNGRVVTKLHFGKLGLKKSIELINTL